MFLKGVAYIQDGLPFRKLAFWVCLKTRCVTKRDALVLATLRYLLCTPDYLISAQYRVSTHGMYFFKNE